MSLVRHSLMLVGPSGVGKSRIVEALHRALESAQSSESEPPMVGQSHREARMNPKAITAPQMFGSLDVVANEWTEGGRLSVARVVELLGLLECPATLLLCSTPSFSFLTSSLLSCLVCTRQPYSKNKFSAQYLPRCLIGPPLYLAIHVPRFLFLLNACLQLH